MEDNKTITNPEVKEDWTFAEENYAEIETGLKGLTDNYAVNYAEYDTNFATPEVEYPSPLSLYHEPENQMLAEFTGDHYFVMYSDAGHMLVSLNLKTGDHEFGEDYTPSEAAEVFWETVGKVKVEDVHEQLEEYDQSKKDLTTYKQLYHQTEEILRTVRHNIGTPEGENVIEFSAPPGIADDMPELSIEQRLETERKDIAYFDAKAFDNAMKVID